MTYSDQDSLNKSTRGTNPKSKFRQACRKISLRRKKFPVVQAEAGGKKHGRKFSPVKIFRRDRLKGKKLQCISLKKIKECYWLAVNDILEGHQAIHTFQQQLVVNTSFAIPVMGLSFTTFPNHRPI